MLVSAVQFLNAQYLIFVTDGGIVTELRFTAPKNAEFPMIFTLEGIENEVSLLPTG